MIGSDAPLSVAVDLAVRAGEKVMGLLREPLQKSRKPDGSIVTNADHAANDLILRGLNRSFPSHAVLSEETGLAGSPGADFAWVIDPLDGTRAYAGGRLGFSVMMGLLHEGVPILGVVFVPSEERLYEASKGGGSYQTHRGARTPLRVSDRADPSLLAVTTSTGFPEELKASLLPAFPGRWLDPVNSVGVKAGLLARGDADVYFHHRAVHLWDTAGPQVVLEEAGGRMTLWDGSALSYDLKGSFRHPGPLLATNGACQEYGVRTLADFRLKK